MRRVPDLLLVVPAVAIGLAVAWVDSRPNWDDTGVTAGALALSTAVLAAISPARPWRWALLVGAWIPALAFARGQGPGALLALVAAAVGAFAGSGARRMLAPEPHAH